MPLFNPLTVEVQEDGTPEGAVNTLNFTGDVDVTVSGNLATVDITGGGGTPPLLPTTGTGTATGAVTGDLATNDLSIINGGAISQTATSITHTAGQHTINGILDVNGATDIVGNSTITGTLTMTGAIKTSANNTDDIGDSTNSFKDAYVRRVLLDGSTSGVAEIKSDALANTMNGVTLTGTGIVPSTSFYIIQGSDFTLTDNNADQNAFPAAGDTWTLQGATTYYFEGQYYITSGAASHSIAMGFTLGGGASINSILYSVLSWPVAINTAVSTQTTTMITQVASTVVNAAGANAVQYTRFQGHIRMNAGGTVVPIIKFSAAPGGTNLMKQDSYIRFTPVGSNTVSGIGPVE